MSEYEPKEGVKLAAIRSINRGVKYTFTAMQIQRFELYHRQQS
jgi:hypothetical protein